MAKPQTPRQSRAKVAVVAAVTASVSPAPAPTPAVPAPEAAPAAAVPTPEPAKPETIRMLVGQEGPELSRVPGQMLTIGTDLDADEADRLILADFAERV